MDSRIRGARSRGRSRNQRNGDDSSNSFLGSLGLEPFFAVKIGSVACFCMKRGAMDYVQEDVEELIGWDQQAGESKSDVRTPENLTARTTTSDLEVAQDSDSSSSSSPEGPEPDTPVSARQSELIVNKTASSNLRRSFANAAKKIKNVHTIKETSQWINRIIRTAWPKTVEFITKHMEDTMLPQLRDKLPEELKDIHLKNFHLGTHSPPTVNDIVIHETPFSIGCELRFHVSFQPSEFDVDINIPGIGSLGIDKIRIHGVAVIRIEPFLEETPVVGGCTFFFLQPPTIDLGFQGVAKFANYKVITEMIEQVTRTALANYLVLPHTIAYPSVAGMDLALLQAPAPIGVLRVTALEAKHLRADDIDLLGTRTSDPYVKVQVGDEAWRSVAVPKNCNPTWDSAAPENTHDFVIFDLDQRVDISVWDEDQLSSDDFLGSAHHIRILKALAMSEQPIHLHGEAAEGEATHMFQPGDMGITYDDHGYVRGISPDGQAREKRISIGDQIEKVGTENYSKAAVVQAEKSGVVYKVTFKLRQTLFLRFQWLQLVDYQEGCDGCLLTVKVGRVIMPVEHGKKAGLAARVGRVDKETPIRKWKDPKEEGRKLVTKLKKLMIKHHAAEHGVEVELTPQLAFDQSKKRVIGVDSMIHFPITLAQAEEESVQLHIINGENISRCISHLVRSASNLGGVILPLKDVRDHGEFFYPWPQDQAENYSLRNVGGAEAEIVLSKRGLRRVKNTKDLVKDRKDEPSHAHGLLTNAASLEELNDIWHRNDSKVRQASQEAQETLKARGVTEHIESTAWANILLERAWPYAIKAAKKILEEKFLKTVDAHLHHTIQGLKLARYYVPEDEPPRFGPVEVHDTGPAGSPTGCELRGKLDYNSEVDIHFTTPIPGASFGISAFTFSAFLCVRLGPMLAEEPIIGGVSMYCLDAPKLDIKFSGLASSLDFARDYFKPIKSIFETVILKTLEEKVVMPNVIGVPLAATVDFAAVNMPSPVGVLRVRAVEARGLQDMDYHLLGQGSSDPYVQLRLGTEVWKSSTVNDDLNPKWDPEKDFYDFVVYDCDQNIDIKLYDEDQMRSELLGFVPPMTITKAVATSKQNKWLKLQYLGTDEEPLDKRTTTISEQSQMDQRSTVANEETGPYGQVKLNFIWHDIFTQGIAFGVNVWLVSIKVKEVFLPAELGNRVGLKATVGKISQSTPIKTGKSVKQIQEMVEQKLEKELNKGKQLGVDVHVDITVADYDPSVRRLELEHSLHMVVYDIQKQDIDTEMEIALVGSRQTVFGTHKVDLKEVFANPAHVYPKGSHKDASEVQFKAAHGDANMKAEIKVRINGLKPGEGWMRRKA